MSPAHFVAFYVVLPPFVGLLVLQLVLWLVAEALAGTGAKGRSCEIARLLGYEPEAGHSCRYCWCAADPPPLKWSDLRYVFDIQEDCNGKEAIQA
jgi:hypothetical protein